MLFFFHLVKRKILFMNLMNPKRLYLSIMVAFAVLCAGQAVRLWFERDMQDGFMLYIGGWILLSMISLTTFLCVYGKMMKNMDSPRFGQVYTSTRVQINPISVKKYKSSLRMTWKKLSLSQKIFARSMAICLLWGVTTLFLTAFWRVWQTPQPWPQYTEAELIYLSTGLLLITVMGMGLAWNQTWAGPVGYLFSFLQMIWFPVGLFTGLLLMGLIKYVAREPIQVRLKKEPYMKNRYVVKRSFASKRPVNKTLLFELDKEDAA
jgi:hypothetical protein